MNWFYSENGQQRGPVSEMEFTEMARRGALSPGTLVWREGLPDWQPLSQVRPDLIQIPSTSPTFGGMAIPQQDKNVLLQQMREGVVSEASLPGARRFVGFWWRVLARIIDTIVLTIVICVIAMPLGIMFGFAGAGSTSPSEGMSMMLIQQLIQTIIQWGISATYFTWMTSKYGATLGKLALGFQVVTADGPRPTTMRCFGRWAADNLLGGIICGLVIMVPVGIVIALGFTQFKEMMEGNEQAVGGFIVALGGAVFVGSLVGSFPWWMAGIDAEKRALHDRICATRVVWK
ncbi:MAG: GYF domain-containing protein [Verrucomicrobium sp.]|nr:RDD family protein [Verrucomicrobium sp.]